MNNEKLKLNIIFNKSMSENTYFLHYENECDGILIDPGIDKDKIEEYLQKNNFIPKYILLTHGHFDHIYSANYFRDKFKIDIYASLPEKELLEDKIKNLSHDSNVDCEVFDCIYFNDKDYLNLLNIKIKCLITPGHTKGSACFYIEDAKILISGDTLFCRTYGNTSFYSGSDIDMEKSLKEILFKLPEDTEVYPGHGMGTTIKYEKQNNSIFEQ